MYNFRPWTVPTEWVLSLPLAGAHTTGDVDDVLAAQRKLHAAFTQ